jgi:hypothetical protein
MLEEDLREEAKSSSNLLALDSIATAATAPLGQTTQGTTNDNKISKRRLSSSETSTVEKKEIINKEKQPSFVRSLSSLTILGSKKSTEDDSKSRRRGSSISSVQVADVIILNVVSSAILIKLKTISNLNIYV